MSFVDRAPPGNASEVRAPSHETQDEPASGVEVLAVEELPQAPSRTSPSSKATVAVPPAFPASSKPTVTAPSAFSASAFSAQDGPRELFARANRVRQEGDAASALALYRELLQRFPASNEAVVARLSVGRLLEAGGDASGALAEYNAYLADGRRTELREEALVGRARMYEKLALREEERQAWQELSPRIRSRFTRRTRANRIDAR